MNNRIYTVFKYRDKKLFRTDYFIEIYGVSGKIGINDEQFDNIIKNAKAENYCRHTEIANPEWRPEGYSSDCYVDQYVIS